MYPTTKFNVASVQVSLLPISVLKIEGYFKGSTADRWLQVFDSCTTPAASAVPLREWPAAMTTEFYKEFKNGEMRLGEGLFVGLSTTEGTWTASEDTMDITVETDKQPHDTTVVIVGDKTTNVTGLEVWAQGATTAKTNLLHGLLVTEVNAVACVLLIYADDAKTGVPLVVRPVTASESFTMYFADFRPQSAATPGGTMLYGCQVVIADAMPASGVAPAVTTTGATICAIAKTS